MLMWGKLGKDGGLWNVRMLNCRRAAKVVCGDGGDVSLIAGDILGRVVQSGTLRTGVVVVEVEVDLLVVRRRWAEGKNRLNCSPFSPETDHEDQLHCCFNNKHLPISPHHRHEGYLIRKMSAV